MRESKCYISVACFHYGGSDLLRFGKFEVLITSQALLSQKQPIFMQNYNFVKNDVFVAKICKYALYESSEGLFCAPRKAANFCHPVTIRPWKVFYANIMLPKDPSGWKFQKIPGWNYTKFSTSIFEPVFDTTTATTTTTITYNFE